MKSNLIFKRIGAYLIDILLISLVSTALTYISFINPKYDEYLAVSEEYQEVLNEYYDEKINTIELNEKVQDLSYELNKSGYVYTIGSIVIAFLYFGVFAYATKGQTLGKKLMGIKVTSAKKEKDLKLYNYFIRVFILNSIILNVLTLIAICFTKGTYTKIYNIAANIDTILFLVIFFMILIRKDGRGLHDILAGTKVVDLNAPVISEEIKEAVIEEKSEIEEEKEVVKKPKSNKTRNDEIKENE